MIMASSPLTYLIKIDGATGDSTIEGYEGYFAVDEFTFEALTRSTAAARSGGTSLDPLMVALGGMPASLVTLLKDAATGKTVNTVELVGLSLSDGPPEQVYDLKLKNVTVAGLAIDGGHDSAVAFSYRAGSETIRQQQADGSFDAGKTVNFGASTTPVNHDALAALAHAHDAPSLTYLIKIDGATGDSTIDGYDGYFTVDEFTFEALTQLAGSGRIGRAQLDPLMVDLAGRPEGLATLLKDAVTGKALKSVELVGLMNGDGALQKVYDLALRDVTVAGIAADGGHDTAVAFNFRSGSETITGQNADGSLAASQTASFGASTQAVSHDTLAAFAHANGGSTLTYLIKIDGATGDSIIDGYEGYFTVDEFTFEALNRLASGSGARAGRAQLDPLTVDLAGMPEGLATLLRDAVTGKTINAIDLVGLDIGEDGPKKVYDLTLRNVTIAGIAADGGHDTAVAFNFRSGSETIRSENADGALDAGQTVAFGASTSAVDHDALAAFAHANGDASLAYLIKIDGVTGDSTIDGYEGYFTVDEFTFEALTRLAAGSGARTGNLQLDPLTVDISSVSEGLATLLKDAVSGKAIKMVDLVGLDLGEDGPKKIYDLTLKDVTVAGMAADGGHDTAVAFNFRSGSETIRSENADGALDAGQTVSFGASNTAVNHDALAAFAHEHEAGGLQYLLKVDGIQGDSTLDGYQGFFTVDEFTFEAINRLANSGSGAGTGKLQLDPLMVDLAAQSSGLTALLHDEITGRTIRTIELVGITDGESPQKVYDLTLSNVRVSGIAADGGFDTAVAFSYAKGSETIKTQLPDGGLDAGQTVNFGASTTSVNHDVLAAFAHSHSDFFGT
jgi:hypothetical protein